MKRAAMRLACVGLLALLLLPGCESIKGMTPQEKVALLETSLLTTTNLVAILRGQGVISDPEAIERIEQLTVAAEGALDSLKATVESGGELDFAAALKAFNAALKALNEYVNAQWREGSASMGVTPRHYLGGGVQ